MSLNAYRHRSIFNSGGSGGGGSDPALEARVEVLEDNISKYIYYEEISADTGQVTVPTSASVILNQFPSGIDALVSTIVNGYPSMEIPTETDGTPVVVTSFDASGNYVLSGDPSSYDVALIYLLSIDAKDYSNLDIDFIIPGYDEDDGSLVPYTHTTTVAGFSPVDSQFTYFGEWQVAASAAAGNSSTYLRENACPATGIIIACVVSVRIGTTGSAEDVSILLRDTTAGILHTVTTTGFTLATATVIKSYVKTGLSIPVTQGNLCQTLFGAPAWVTNPLGVVPFVTYIIQT